MFPFLKKSARAPDASAAEPAEGKSKALAENLYKRSTEILGKNKTLSLLRKLYEMSVLTLRPEELAARITQTVLTDLSFELAGIFLYDETHSELVPLSLASSERFSAVQAEAGVSFAGIAIPVARSPLMERAIRDKVPQSAEDLQDIWGELIPNEAFDKIREETHVKASLAYPLISGSRTIGALAFCLNRSYDQLVDHERESIESFINVVAVALDKALLDRELKMANSQLASANARLKELDQQKSEFVSLASHQLRSPLTAIRGYVSLITEGEYGKVSAEIEEPLTKISDSVKSMIIMVEDFLSVSRIEQGRMKFDFADFDLRKLAEDVAYELKPNADKAGLSLTFSAEEGKSYLVHADQTKIKQTIINFLDNSIKYTPHGSIAVSVGKNDAGKILIAIKDTGVGISAATLPKLFNKFTRAADANKTNVQGTGLGLYVAKQMIEAHKGRAWAESAGEGKGSTFFIELQGK